MVKFLKSLLWPYLTSYVYFVSVFYVIHHTEQAMDAATGWGVPILLAVFGPVVSICLRKVPVGPIALPFFGALFASFLLMIVLGSKRADPEAVGFAIIGLFLGFLIGFLENGRRRLIKHPLATRDFDDDVNWRY